HPLLARVPGHVRMTTYCASPHRAYRISSESTLCSLNVRAYNAAMHQVVQRRSRAATPEDYTAADIEVLEGLEPVRRRPGMFIGGTDERSLHHLAAELLDNALDEAAAGHAGWIEVAPGAGGRPRLRAPGPGRA